MIDASKLKKLFFVNGVPVDPINHCVGKGDKLEKISPRALQILKLLIQKDGDPVTHAELEEHVWNGPVSENALYQQMTGLRRLLADDSDNAAIIKTIPKRGYQLVADIRFTDRPSIMRVFSRIRPSLAITACIVAAAVAAASVVVIKDYSKSAGPGDVLLDTLAYLRYPGLVVALESGSTDDSTGLLQSVEQLIEHHLDQNLKLHIVNVPKISTDSHRQKLLRHFEKHSKLEYLITRHLDDSDKNDLKLTVRIASAADGETVSELTMHTSTAVQDISDNLVRFEKQLLEKMQELHLVDTQQPFLDDDAEGNRLMLEAAATMAKLSFVELQEKQRALAKVQKALDRNPRNLVLYSILLRLKVSIVLFNSGYDMTALLNAIKFRAAEMARLYPNYYKSHYANAMYRYWTQQYAEAASSLSTAVKLKPFYPYLLTNFSWNLRWAGEQSTVVDQLNYALNPFIEMAVHFQRDSLLAANKAGEAVAMLNEYVSWDTLPRDWRIEAQIQAGDKKLEEFAGWYRHNYAHLDHDPQIALREKQISLNSVPSRYIGYMLLNAGQAERARFWQFNGREEQMIYFDIRIIDLLADVWQGKWQAEKWRNLSDIAEDRRAFQHTTDKLNVFYFHYYAGLYQSASDYLLEVFPEFSKPDLTITRDNFRYAVYHAQTQKYLGDYANAGKTITLLKEYLSDLGTVSNRDVDFGIADAEFYALLGDKETALRLLEEAIRQQGWLPNAFWRWPPIEHNIALANLRGAPEFEALSAFIRQKLARICFEQVCPQSG